MVLCLGKHIAVPECGPRMIARAALETIDGIVEME
jgi:hypothetical protein